MSAGDRDVRLKRVKERLLKFYERHETAVDVGFFLGGVLFDVFTLSAIDDPLSILQQVVYLLGIGLILFYDFLERHGLVTIAARLKPAWNYRDLALHFVLGSLLSVYSLFFIKSASVFASFVFILAMAGLMIANELKVVQRSPLNIKIALYLVCVFSFFSMMFPLMLGFVGWVPFLLSLSALILFVYGAHRLLSRRVKDPALLGPALSAPGGTVAAVFLVFYLLGWIPPVPLSVEFAGIYHGVQKSGGQYLLSHENPWWRFWRSGDQDFVAEPGDTIYLFARIFSPARFSDSVVLHWQRHDPRDGWTTTDRIPMAISGGRAGGFRGFAAKKNYSAGDWRVKIETTDGVEIGRLGFKVTLTPEPAVRKFETEIQ